MYQDKQLLATRLYEVLDNLILIDDKGSVSIDDLLNPQQKYALIMHIINGLPKTDFERALEFNNQSEEPKEVTHIVTDFIESQRRFKLILEEIVKLGNAIGYNEYSLYMVFISIHANIQKKNIEPNLTNVLKILTNLLFVTYGTIDVFNLTPLQYDAMQEVYQSYNSKLIPKNEYSLSIVKESVEKLKIEGYNIITNNLKNNNITIRDRESNKMLKPVTYIKPNLQSLIINYLKTK